MHGRGLWAWAALALITAAAGCGAGDKTLSEADPGAVETDPRWSGSIKPILDVYCNGCHSPEALPGNAAGFDYSTCEAAKIDIDDTLESTFREQTMPPPTGFPMPTHARDTLEVWYAKAARCD